MDDLGVSLTIFGNTHVEVLGESGLKEIDQAAGMHFQHRRCVIASTFALCVCDPSC